MLQIIRVTRPRPRPFYGFLFLHFWEIIHVHPCAKFQVYSFTRFGDMSEGVPNFTKITWHYYLVLGWQCAKYQIWHTVAPTTTCTYHHTCDLDAGKSTRNCWNSISARHPHSRRLQCRVWRRQLRIRSPASPVDMCLAGWCWSGWESDNFHCTPLP